MKDASSSKVMGALSVAGLSAGARGRDGRCPARAPARRLAGQAWR